MTSLPLAERDRFWVGQVRSIMPGLTFRFRAFIPVIVWSMVPLMRSTSFLSLVARELVLSPSCGPSAAVRNEGRSGLAVDYEMYEKIDRGERITRTWTDQRRGDYTPHSSEPRIRPQS